MRTAVSILFLALGTLPAFAQYTGANGTQPRLKPAATVSGDIVRIGDLVENAGVAANTPVFRAPDLGQTGAVPARAVLDAVRPYGLIIVDVRGIAEVAVTRASRTIGTEEIEAQIVRALTARYNLGKPETIKTVFDRDVRPIHLDATNTADLSIMRASYEPSSRRFDVVFELTDGARTQWRYSGSAVETFEVAVPTRALGRGEIVKASDVVFERRPKNELTGEAPAPIADVTGMAIKRSVRPGQPLRTADLMKPELVQKNDMVTIHYQVPGIALTMRGKALDSGAEGDTISVLNIQSKRTVQGIVTGQGHVTMVSPVPTRVTTNTADSAQPASARSTQ